MFAQVGAVASSKSPHIDARIRVEALDQDQPLDRPGHLDAAIADFLRRERHSPIAGPDVFGLREEIRQRAGIETVLPGFPPRKQLEPPRIEILMEGDKKPQRLWCQNLVMARPRSADQREFWLDI